MQDAVLTAADMPTIDPRVADFTVDHRQVQLALLGQQLLSVGVKGGSKDICAWEIAPHDVKDVEDLRPMPPIFHHAAAVPMLHKYYVR